jgi:hypothetical protein
MCHWIFYLGSIYYALIKTGHNSCSKECYPKLTLYGQMQQHTHVDLRQIESIDNSSMNNRQALNKSQLDVFQWYDNNIHSIDRIQLQVNGKMKQSKCYWHIEWLFVIHQGYAYTGRDNV